MKPVIIISLAFVLLIPIIALGQEIEYEAIKEQERLEQKQGTFEELQQKATSVRGRNHRFSDLSFAQQTVVLKEAENTEFFGTLHFLTMMGMFCLPKYGGNRDHAGWDLIGFSHQHAWQPPFGYYDAAVHAQTLKQGDDHGHS